jgi:hypothetical protein
MPLSSSTLYGTYKIRDPERRARLALLQSRLSGGLVFRGRYARLEGEFASFLGDVYGIDLPPRPDWWFLSDLFFEAMSDNGDERNQFAVSDKVIAHVRENPAAALFDYLTSAPDAERKVAVHNWSDGSDALRKRVEERRARHKDETLDMKMRIYNALMLIDELPLLMKLAGKYGVSWRSTGDIGDVAAQRLMEEVAIYHSEREIVVRLEAQNRAIHENDFRDVQAYCAAVVYADEVIGENQLVNLARQGGLGKKYNTRLETDILAIAA